MPADGNRRQGNRDPGGIGSHAVPFFQPTGATGGVIDLSSFRRITLLQIILKFRRGFPYIMKQTRQLSQGG